MGPLKKSVYQCDYDRTAIVPCGPLLRVGLVRYPSSSGCFVLADAVIVTFFGQDSSFKSTKGLN